MNRVVRWATLLALAVWASACQQSESAAPNSSARASSDSVRIVSISPAVETALRVGDKVSVKVDVEYNLTSAASGTITLVIQQGESGRPAVANETQVIQKGSGKLALAKDIEIPDTAALQVFTPLNPQGGTSTRTVDTRTYKVVKGS